MMFDVGMMFVGGFVGTGGEVVVYSSVAAAPETLGTSLVIAIPAEAVAVAGAGVTATGTILLASDTNGYNQASQAMRDAEMLKEKEIKWSNHGYKHFPSKNVSWKDIVASTKHGAAKYHPSIDIETLERDAWKTGQKVTNGKTWKVKKYDYIVGACSGNETKFVRIEMTSGTIHGHPITESEYLKLLS